MHVNIKPYPLCFSMWLLVYCQYVSEVSPRQFFTCIVFEIKFFLIPNLFSPSHQNFDFPFQRFHLHHVTSSLLSTKPPWCWNGASLAIWADVKTSFTTSSARSASPSEECALGVMTTSIFRRVTWASRSAGWRSATCRPTLSTALRSKQSTGFPTRAHIHLKSLQLILPQIKQVSFSFVRYYIQNVQSPAKGIKRHKFLKKK